MKFKCSQQNLSKALNTVSKAVSSKSTIPVLSGILIEAESEGYIKLSASDMDFSIQKKIEADVIEAGSIVLSAKIFLEMIRRLPSGDVTITETGNDIVEIKSTNSEFTLVGFSADEFPSIKDDEVTNTSLSFEKEKFKDMIKKTSFAASVDESKGILLGVLIEIKNNMINMVSLDGFRMAVAREEYKSNEERSIVIPARILNEINKIISEADEADQLNMYLSSRKTVITLGTSVITARLLEGEFIKYEGILTKDNEIKIIAGRNEMIESIERASLLTKTGKNNLIRVSVKNNLMTISSRSEEGNIKEQIIVEKTGNDIEIGFNSKYMLDALKAIDDEEILFTLKTGTTPALICPIEGNSYDYLVLPVRLSTN